MSKTLIQSCVAFIGKQRALTLATVNEQGLPHASHAPFAIGRDGQLLIFVSELSAHTGNLRHAPNTGVLIIDHQTLASVGSTDEGATISAQDSETVFAPNRLSLNCSAQFIARAHSDYEPGVARLRSRLGETMDTLAALPDFNLVQLTPLAGTFIQGFARAHTLSAGDLAVIFDRAANR